MGITDQRFLGHIVDPEESDYEQTAMNEDLLFEHDQIEFLRSFNLRISDPMLKYYLDHIDMSNTDYFTLVLNSLAKTYSLNYLKLENYNINDRNEYIKGIIQTIRFIKIKMISLVEIKKIDKDISREEMEQFLHIESAPKLLTNCIKYIDAESYKKFVSRLFVEVKQEFIE